MQSEEDAAEEMAEIVVWRRSADERTSGQAEEAQTAPEPEEECPLCFELPGDARRCAPCAGGHRACRGCWLNWRAESVKKGGEFCCPMCRECLEGWEP